MTLDARVAIRDRARRPARARASVGLALASLLALGPSGQADERPPALAPGLRVRVTAGADGGKIAGPIRGTLAAIDASQITIDVLDGGPGASRVRIPIERVSKLEASRGRHGHALLGAAIGFAGAAAAGAILGDSGPSVSCPVPPNPCGGSSPKLGQALAAGLLGLPVGALVGHFVRTERWTPVGLSHVDVAGGPLPGGGLRGAVRLSF